MSIWPFAGKNSQNDEVDELPKEVKDYYESSERERLGVTWLLAFGTLILTIILAFSIFFGGCWVYRKITQKTPAPASSQTATPKTTTETGRGSSGRGQSGNAGKPEHGQSSNLQSTGASSTSTSKPGTPAKTSPNTGPGNLAVVFVLGSLAGTTMYYVRQYRRQN